MLGGLVKAVEAERMGLVNKVVPAENVFDEALKIAKRFANGPIQAISWTKICLNKIILDRMNLLMDAGVAYEYHSMSLPDHLEAAQAFAEKRTPEFKGKLTG
jgi:enoyl-CoA hydratase